MYKYTFIVVKDEEFRRQNYRITKEMFQRRIYEYSRILNYTLDIPALTKAIEFMYLPEEKDFDNQTLMRGNYIDVSII